MKSFIERKKTGMHNIVGGESMKYKLKTTQSLY